jgi:hypothetical protein
MTLEEWVEHVKASAGDPNAGISRQDLLRKASDALEDVGAKSEHVDLQKAKDALEQADKPDDNTGTIVLGVLGIGAALFGLHHAAKKGWI